MEFQLSVEERKFQLEEQRERDALVAQYVAPVTPRADGAAKLPALVERVDGATILYAGKLTSLYGEPGLGKSWAALMMAVDAMRDHDATVLWLDYEDSPRTLADRAVTIGALELLQGPGFKFLLPAIADDPPALRAAQDSAGSQPQALVVIDAAESAGCPSDGSDVAPWFRRVIDPWLAVGCAVLLLDHVPKRREDRGRGGIGSQHKLAHVNGAALYLTGQPWTKTANGKVRIVNQKDRAGDLPVALNKTLTTLVGTWQVSPRGDRVFSYSWDMPDTDDDADDLVAPLLDALATAGRDGIRGSRGLRDVVAADSRKLDSAVDHAMRSGLVEREKDGRAFVYRLTQDGQDVVSVA